MWRCHYKRICDNFWNFYSFTGGNLLFIASDPLYHLSGYKKSSIDKNRNRDWRRRISFFSLVNLSSNFFPQPALYLLRSLCIIFNKPFYHRHDSLEKIFLLAITPKE